MHAIHHSVKIPSALTSPRRVAFGDPALSQRERERRHCRSEAGFSLTELLVVIGIIVLLVGLLLVALGQVQKRAKRTQSESTMQQFGNACAAFQAEHGFYPGVIPDEVLAAVESAAGAAAPLTSTENALLHLMGGYRVLSPMDAVGSQVEIEYQAFTGTAITIGVAPNDWDLKVNVQRIGEGPVINGKPYGPYYTPGQDELQIVDGQKGETTLRIPDLVDAWGQPIIFAKQARNRGPLILDPNSPPPPAGSGPRPQFMLGGIKPYLNSDSLAELGRDQIFDPDPTTGNTAGCVLGIGGTPNGWEGDNDSQNKAFAAILAHQAFYKSPMTNPIGNPLYGSARGAFALISAGPDGIFFSGHDGPGSPGTPITDLTSAPWNIIGVGPRVIDEFDDVRVYGGG